MTIPIDQLAGADVSDCGRYRWRLWRRWTKSQPVVLWVMLNPSTADGAEDDPTIRRCIAFARAWGYGGIRVVNLFAWRCTAPYQLRAVKTEDLFVHHNHEVIAEELAGPDVGRVIVGWGATAAVQVGAECVASLAQIVEGSSPHPLLCLGTTKDGHPRHPLYVPKSTTLAPWPKEQEESP